MASADIGQSSAKNVAASPQSTDSAALEQRIDELLKDVEQSLEALEQGGIDTAPADTIDPTDSASTPDVALGAESAGTEPAPPITQASTDAETTPFDLSALSADLESALHQAEEAVRSQQETTAPQVAAPIAETLVAAPIAQTSTEPTAESPAPAASAETVDALDAALAEAATAAALDDGIVAQTAAEAPAPAPIAAQTTPEPVGVAEAPASAAVVSEPAPTVAAAPAAPEAPSPAPAPARARPKREGPALVERILRAIASPLAFMSPQVRDLIGWFGVWVAFNAVCVWVFVLLVNPGTPRQADANAPAAAREPAVELNSP